MKFPEAGFWESAPPGKNTVRKKHRPEKTPSETTPSGGQRADGPANSTGFGRMNVQRLFSIPARARAALVLSLIPLAGVAFFFRAVFIGGEQFAFRDIAHFYHPLDAYIDECLAAGTFPGWYPYENFGQPLAASGTAAVFYPVKWLRLLVPDKPQADALYLGFHLFIAAVTLYRLGRHFRCSRHAALFGAVAYAFGGAVLYQYVNPPFLVGAAWFPEAFRQLDRLIAFRRIRNLSGAATVITLMILGGDPQAAYHAGLLALPLSFAGAFRGRETKVRSDERRNRIFHAFFYSGGQPVFLVGLAFLFATMLAAVQILPSFEFNRLSERTLLPESHRQILYHFSVPPIRFLELFFPNIGGRQFPINSRWFSYWSTDVWTPSLYMGILPILLAFSSMRFWKFSAAKDNRTVFLSWFALAALVFSLGKYAPFYEQLTRLPEYDAFRYPGKWSTLAAVPLAILAAQGFDRLFYERRFPVVFSFFLAAFFLSALVLRDVAGFLPGMFAETAHPCPLFGPCDSELASLHFSQGIVHAASVVLIVLGILVLYQAQTRYAKSGFVVKYASAALLSILCIDLFIANDWMIATCDRKEFAVASPIRDEIFRQHDLAGRRSLPVVYRLPWWAPPEFGKTSSPDRLAEAIRWDVQTCWPKYPLLAPPERRVMLADVRGTMISGVYCERINAIRRAYHENRIEDFEKGLAALGVEWVIAPHSYTLQTDHAEEHAVFCELPDAPDDVCLWKIREPAEQQDIGYDSRLIFRNIPRLQRFGAWISLFALALLLFSTLFGNAGCFRLPGKIAGKSPGISPADGISYAARSK